MTRVYVDTSVVIALANLDDEFHNASVVFFGGLRKHTIPTSIGPPFLLEVAKAAEQRGAQAALRILSTAEEYEIELTRRLNEGLWGLADEYVSQGVLGERRTVDLLHYASASLLGCTHLASWDKKHFNHRIGERVNKVNAPRGLTNLKVGYPVIVSRDLGIE